MGQVEFDEENLDSYKSTRYTEIKSVIVRFVEKLGVPEQYVNVTLISIGLISLAMSIFVLTRSSESSGKPIPIDKNAMQKMQQNSVYK